MVQENSSVVDLNLLKHAYRDMLLLRRFEERAAQLYGMGLIGGFCHLYIGEEAVAVGIKSTLKKGDAMITSYRDHGVMLATGSDPSWIMAELLGRAGGCSKGKGGSMHMFDTKNAFYGGHGIVGAQVPLGTGLGFAFKYREQNNIVVTMFGDGAANQGQVYESFNMAKLWNLPVLYVIENNEYAMGTSVARGCSTTELYKRGESFGIPGMQVDGMSFLAVHETFTKVCQHVRSGKGPIIVETKTYRYRGHSMSDPATYRTKAEVEEYKEHKDPIVALKTYMLSNRLVKDDFFKEAEKQIKTVVDKAIEFAKNSPEPDESELYTDVYFESKYSNKNF